MIFPAFHILALSWFIDPARTKHCHSKQPLCGNDGKTYKNICEFNYAQRLDTDLEILYDGHCSIVKLSGSHAGAKPGNNEISCTLTVMPVCGNDGKTYRNQCFYEYYKAKKKSSSLAIKHKGWCNKQKKTSKQLRNKLTIV